MKALSIRQPWASLIVNGYKPLENRSWNTKFRGEFYIHAGKKFDHKGYQWVNDNFPNVDMSLICMNTGGIVGKAMLINVVHDLEKRLLTETDEPWFFGEYGFILDNAKPLPFVPYKGRLGFFEIKDNLNERKQHDTNNRF